jgi:hypothetical protein
VRRLLACLGFRISVPVCRGLILAVAVRPNAHVACSLAVIRQLGCCVVRLFLLSTSARHDRSLRRYAKCCCTCAGR